ncbi:uncharacterized protein [Paramormyrops kingsleyae]|uniref:uncharacterized protein isoform X2 n=1 Tax=Paramormyrops kingsleyae TaxID=1676925 RepID=UPI003B970AA9
MTDLSEITARQTEHQRLGLLQEAVYWRSQPEVLEDPVALELATRGADLLTEERPPGQQYPLKRVRKCLRRLHERLTRRRDECVARSMADVFATAPPSAARGEKKRGKKAETLQEETPTLFLGACTLLPAWELGREHEGSPLPWEDFAATRLLGLHGAVRKNHSTGGATDTEIDSFTIRWFNLACDRGGGRKERGKDRCQQEA